MLADARNAVLSRFSAYRAETQMVVEYALVLSVITVLAVTAFTVLKPIAAKVFMDVATAL